jgi:hypothetical protein
MEGAAMTALDRSRLLSMVGSNRNLLGAGVMVIEQGRLPQVLRRPQGPQSYITLYQLDSTNRGWSEPLWWRDLQLQLSRVGAPLADLAFAGLMGGAYACFLSLAQEPSTGHQARLREASTAMQEVQRSFNAPYLQLQDKMQRENQIFTTVSNIMKTKHDTVKNTIGNVR